MYKILLSPLLFLFALKGIAQGQLVVINDFRAPAHIKIMTIKNNYSSIFHTEFINQNGKRVYSIPKNKCGFFLVKIKVGTMRNEKFLRISPFQIANGYKTTIYLSDGALSSKSEFNK